MRRSRALPGLLLLLVSLGPAGGNPSFKVRLQPRVDFGDFANAGGDSYDSQSDFYVRRSRLEISGKPADGISYLFVISGDRLGQRGSSDKAAAPYAYVNYRLSEDVSVRAGLLKLPIIRQRLVSSSRQLFIDRSRPALTLSAGLGGYIVPQVSLHGKLRDGTVNYLVAVADGFQPGDSDSRFSGAAVAEVDRLAFVGRLVFSPVGWLEVKQMESHLGEGRHLSLGLNAAVQNGIEFAGATEDRMLWGGDLSFHKNGLTLAIEYLSLNRSSDADSSPTGWYAQAGYYLSDVNLEPAIRLERYDPDLPGGKDAITTYRGGLNWYREGHNLKFLLNLVHTHYQQQVSEVDGASSRTLLQLQNQLYF